MPLIMLLLLLARLLRLQHGLNSFPSFRTLVVFSYPFRYQALLESRGHCGEQAGNQFKRMARTAALFSKPALTTLDTVLIRIRGTASLALTAAYFVEGVRADRLSMSRHLY